MKLKLSVAVFVCVIVLSASDLLAQGFRVPRDYSFDSKESYHKYDKDVIRFANWLEKIAPGEEVDQVRTASRFFAEWSSGCPYVQFRQNVRIDGMLGDSPEYRLYYQAGWVRYALKHQDSKSKIDAAYAGMTMVLKVYAENRKHRKDANLDELLKLQDQEKLKSWIEQKMD